MSQLPNKQRHLITVTNPRSPVSEAFRALRTNIDFSSVDERIQIIMVTSSGPEEGKSTVTANLAAAYAQADKHVLLIDGDLRKPTSHKTFSLSNRLGLSSLLSQQANLEDTIQESGVPNLSIMTSGPIPPNPAEMMASNRMSAVLQELRHRFDIILIDTPPLLAVTDAQIVASKSDGVIMVVSYGKVKRDIAVKAKAGLDRVGARILGVVLNNVKRKASEGYYYYYYGN
ncbi:CpsD/CapB family tyrosine-protein kinase [Paenibacillus sp. 19GGS1-52]|uniref:CpsD/CapB family tyrosine-protein kinase n=1 Tax=Paenibacillus sp. 19GGS1-52 TaxID=2758563 RepID=UPI001EFB7B8F|nr:CpsD/CapB family tyrosine-protein kinase [Paenibacillus sp. 19GGS1-52]ULO08633.1 CpsD/CapB family tyrosine-protein kinase [Paenibacillus sp. 19GGS1-52]